MVCPHCNHELEASKSICSYCGFVLLSSAFEGRPARALQERQESSLPGWPTSSATNFTNNNEAARQNASPYFTAQNQQYDQRPPLRATRFSATSLPQSEPQGQSITPFALDVASSVPASFEAPVANQDSILSSGEQLRGGNYRIGDQRSYQKWSSHAYEVHWDAQDLFQGNAKVIICEMGLSETQVAVRQAGLRAAMRSLFAVNTQAQVPMLTNVFRENGRDFFVFTPLTGDSLLQYLQRTGRRLQEQEAIECCLQITELLETLSRLDPPLVHGLINPENIQRTRNAQWSLTNFSVVLASGANQYYSAVNPSMITPFTAPDLAESEIDARLDLYSLLAAVYYAITGAPPRRPGGDAPRSDLLNSLVSPSFGAILLKGLHPRASQRYQHPSTLHQELQALRPAMNTSISMSGQEEANRISRQRDARMRDNSQFNENGTMQSSPQQGFVDDRSGRGTGNSYGPEMGNAQATFYGQDGQNRAALQREAPQGRPPMPPVAPQTIDPVAKAFSSLAFSNQVELQPKDLLPRPDELPPIPQGKDILAATLWMLGILICLLIPVLIK